MQLAVQVAVVVLSHLYRKGRFHSTRGSIFYDTWHFRSRLNYWLSYISLSLRHIMLAYCALVFRCFNRGWPHDVPMSSWPEGMRRRPAASMCCGPSHYLKKLERRPTSEQDTYIHRMCTRAEWSFKVCKNSMFYRRFWEK